MLRALPLRLARPLRQVRPGLLAWLDLRRQRRALARLEPQHLDDIGLSPDQARAEAARPIWDAPPHWRL